MRVTFLARLRDALGTLLSFSAALRLTRQKCLKESSFPVPGFPSSVPCSLFLRSLNPHPIPLPRKCERGGVPLVRALCLVAAGCAVGPNYRRPEAPVAPQWLDTG